jgi:hypothetical protein
VLFEVVLDRLSLHVIQVLSREYGGILLLCCRHECDY